jgi:hypothetical protein
VNIIEAIKSGRPFRRPSWGSAMSGRWIWHNPLTKGFRVSRFPDSTHWLIVYKVNATDVLANDWIVYGVEEPFVAAYTPGNKGVKLVDLDATLAEYHGMENTFNIGVPVPEMVTRVKEWIADGFIVKIFTARVDGGEAARRRGLPKDICDKYNDVNAIKKMIQEWCMYYIGFPLEVTNCKDFDVVEIWDDRAVSVIANTGKVRG